VTIGPGDSVQPNSPNKSSVRLIDRPSVGPDPRGDPEVAHRREILAQHFGEARIDLSCRKGLGLTQTAIHPILFRIARNLDPRGDVGRNGQAQNDALADKGWEK
jgi:hypothetical protein